MGTPLNDIQEISEWKMHDTKLRGFFVNQAYEQIPVQNKQQRQYKMICKWWSSVFTNFKQALVQKCILRQPYRFSSSLKLVTAQS